MFYIKIPKKLFESSIWEESPEIRIVWITMLGLQEDNHMVRATEQALARKANVSLGVVQEALAKFMAPSPYGSQEHEGRRIKAVDGGWYLLNGRKYEELMRREYWRTVQSNYRSRKKNSPSLSERIATQTQ